jgi:transcriptional regulator with XRE-family HTH domain
VASQAAGRRLGLHLRRIRIQRGWSLEEVARKMDVPLSRYRSIEMVKKSLPEPDELEALAEVYDTTVDELLRAAGYELVGAA